MKVDRHAKARAKINGVINQGIYGIYMLLIASYLRY